VSSTSRGRPSRPPSSADRTEVISRGSGADEISTFVADLARAQVGSTTNQYAVEQPDLDRPGGAAIRRANLEAHLRRGVRARLMLVGEAPSYQGARFSGVAFTSERDHMPEVRWSSTRTDGWKEPSATIVHRTLRALGLEDETFLWNAVPTHPAGATPLSNRPPTGRELERGHEWLTRVIALLAPIQVVAVGQSAARSLPGCPVVRHPAHGGATRFRSELRDLVRGEE
jgi:hypothetical protein